MRFSSQLIYGWKAHRQALDLNKSAISNEPPNCDLQPASLVLWWREKGWKERERVRESNQTTRSPVEHQRKKKNKNKKFCFIKNASFQQLWNSCVSLMRGLSRFDSNWQKPAGLLTVQPTTSNYTCRLSSNIPLPVSYQNFFFITIHFLLYLCQTNLSHCSCARISFLITASAL